MPLYHVADLVSHHANELALVVRFLDGTSRRIRFFASRLKWSRLVAVTLVSDDERFAKDVSGGLVCLRAVG